MGMPMPQAMPPQGEGGEQMSPEQAKQLIMEALQQLQQVAQQYGFDLLQLLQGGGNSAPPPAATPAGVAPV